MEEQVDAIELQSMVEIGEALDRLQTNEDFKRIFADIFIEAHAVTTSMNFAYFSMEARKGAVEQLHARGVFTKFMNDIKDDAQSARDEINSMMAQDVDSRIMATRIADPKEQEVYFIVGLDFAIGRARRYLFRKDAPWRRTIHFIKRKTKEIIVAADKLFYFRAKDFDDLLKEFSLLEEKEITKDHIEVVKSTVIDNTKDLGYEMVERGGRMIAQVDEDFFPKKFTKRSGIRAFGKAFYIVKKSPNGIASKYTYQVYSWATRLLLFSHHDREMCEAWINFMYSEVQHLDV